MDSLQRKGINFDLNTQALKEYYPKGDWHNAYADVRDFFEANGFEHIQGSGYHSVEAMSEAKAMAVIYQMTKIHLLDFSLLMKHINSQTKKIQEVLQHIQL